MLLGLRAGDPDEEVLGAGPAKESVRDAYLTDNPDDGELLLDKEIEGEPSAEPSAEPSPAGELRSWPRRCQRATSNAECR